MFRIIKCIFLLSYIGYNAPCIAQTGYWQQAIKYNMDVQLDVDRHRLQGTQQITYTNHSPDTLHRLFFHTFWNAFRPGSQMDNRSMEQGQLEISKNQQGIPRYDWDIRIADRIGKLTPDEEGFTILKTLLVEGKPQTMVNHETICEVKLDKPILPGKTIQIQTTWESQVPIQIRRSGRNNKEGIAYTMTQWYPKMAAYDKDGWHPDFYIGREFYGVWGNFDVRITLDRAYKLGGSGVLQNADAIGWGYDRNGTLLKPTYQKLRTWHFKADKVHDFAWAADTAFKHITRKAEGGPLLHFIYKDAKDADKLWNGTADTCAMVYPFIHKNFGAYPWTDYSFIQGGDGGMEYAMASMVQNHTISTAIHEWMHSWYQHLLGTNENRYPWMDEGFTSFAEGRIMAHAKNVKGPTHFASLIGYQWLSKSKLEEALITNANHLNTNYAYNYGSYSKGAMFLVQLGYITGEANLKSILIEYYNKWKFKSPDPDDFLRVAEKVSKMELDWFKEYWINTTKKIDYKIDTLLGNGNETFVKISRTGQVPMPLDVMLTFADGSTELHYFPMDLMFGEKPAEDSSFRKVYPPHRWTNKEILLKAGRKLEDVIKVEIDPSMRMADTDILNNKWERK